MKKTLSILLASLLLVFTLTACGGDRKDSGTDTGGNAATDTNGSGNAGGSGINGTDGTGDSGPGGQDDALAGGEANGTAPGDGALTGDDAMTGDDALTGTDTGTAAKQTHRAGASYDQMLRNARVHDTDGKLWDHENATTPGSAY